MVTAIFACAVSLAFMGAPQEWLQAIGYAGFFYVGFTQVLWVVPLIIVLQRRGFRRASKGALILAAVLFSFTALCSAAFRSGWVHS
jgi:hypothetical protein